MEEIISDIPRSDDWKIIRLIKTGWSKDKKIYVKNHQGIQHLLRISDKHSYEEQSDLYKALSQLNKINIPVSKLLDSGLCNNGKNTFRLFTWIEGKDILDFIDSLSKKEQYQYGYDAGKILKEIHKVKCPSNRLNWGEYYNEKIEKNIINYKNCGITFPNAERLIDFIQNHRELIFGRPQSFHHGDFHLGNMLLESPVKKLAVIDFNRLDFGDPWEEFNRITWSADKSKWFANGQINGYFENKVPKEFFELMALYIGVNQIGSIPWAIPYGNKELEIILSQTKRVLEWYENFDKSIPNWYQEIMKP